MDADKKYVEAINKNLPNGLSGLNNAKIKFLFFENCEPINEKIFLDSNITKDFVSNIDFYMVEPQKYQNPDAKVLEKNYIKLTKDITKYLYIPFKVNSNYTNGYIESIDVVLKGLEKLAIENKESKSFYNKETKSPTKKSKKLDRNAPDYFSTLEKNILLNGKSDHKDKKVSKVAKEILKYRKIKDILDELMTYSFMNDEIYTSNVGLFISYSYYKKNKFFFNNPINKQNNI